MARLKDYYNKEVVKKLKERFSYGNVLEVPRLQKVVINMGLGEATQNPKIVDTAVAELLLITGQKPVVRKAKKAIANFKLREGLPIGVSVTLRKEYMYEFMDRLISIALPRVRDFRGISRSGFDGRGNYTLGLPEQIIFPEIDIEKTTIRGMNVTVVTSAKTDEEAEVLLEQLGFPFRKRSEQNKGEPMDAAAMNAMNKQPLAGLVSATS